MPIISMSITEDLLKELEVAEKDQEFSGRSDFIRKAISKLIAEQKSKTYLTGNVDAVLMIKHPEKNAEKVSALRHRHQNLIQTHIHTHLENHHCLELFMLKGQGEKIKSMTKEFESSKRVDLVKLNVF